MMGNKFMAETMEETRNGMVWKTGNEAMKETWKGLGRDCKVNGMEFIEETGNGIRKS